MKKIIGVLLCVTASAVVAIAQMPQSNLPRFVRWVDNNLSLIHI